MTLLLWLVACATPPSGGDADSSDDGSADSADTADTGADSGDTYDLDDPVCPAASDYVGEPPRNARVLSGDGRWTLDFDATAEAAGYEDCSYHRSYPRLLEVQGHAWQCPECTWLTGGDATVDEGYDDCFTLISSSDVTRTEHYGFGQVDGAPHLFRAGNANLTLGGMGALSGAGTEADPYVATWTDDATLDAGGAFVLSATVTLVESTDAGEWIEDPYVPREEPYACGWSQCNPGGPSPALTLSTGGVLPNERFTDSCDDTYDLWDAWGRYVVVDASSPDCGPCRTMAEHEEAWVEEMAARGITVEWVTLLNASLGDINLPADAATLDAWVDAFAVKGPVVADEGYAYALFPDYVGDSDGGMSFPTVIVVNPDMQVLGWDDGFATEEAGGAGFSVIEGLILADAATR